MFITGTARRASRLTACRHFIMMAPGSQGKSGGCCFWGFREAAPSPLPLPFQKNRLYPFYFKVLSENQYSTNFCVEVLLENLFLTHFCLFLPILFACVVFWAFFWFCLQFSLFWTILKLLWKQKQLLHLWGVLSAAGSTGACSSAWCRRWRPATLEAWPSEFLAKIGQPYLSFLPSWTSRTKHQTPDCFLLEILNFEAKFPPNKRLFNVCFFLISCQDPTKQKPIRCCFCFCSPKKLHFSCFFSIPFICAAETSEASCMQGP